MSRNKEHRGAAFGGAPLGLCSLFLLIYFLYYEYVWIFLIYSIYIEYCFGVISIAHPEAFVPKVWTQGAHGKKKKKGPLS